MKWPFPNVLKYGNEMSKKSSNIKGIIIISRAIFSLLCVLPVFGFASTPSMNKCHSLMSLYSQFDTLEFTQNKKLLLFVFDFNDFMCMSCLESFLSFCHSLPPHTLEENSWGILTIGSAIRRSELTDSVKIAETKLRGFVMANRIKFPIFIDKHQIFQQFAKKGSSVLLFDKTNNILKEYIFPLSRDQIGEIQQIVLGF
jgi:hypothetical protein